MDNRIIDTGHQLQFPPYVGKAKQDQYTPEGSPVVVIETYDGQSKSDYHHSLMPRKGLPALTENSLKLLPAKSSPPTDLTTSHGSEETPTLKEPETQTPMKTPVPVTLALIDGLSSQTRSTEVKDSASTLAAKAKDPSLIKGRESLKPKKTTSPDTAVLKAVNFVSDTPDVAAPLRDIFNMTPEHTVQMLQARASQVRDSAMNTGDFNAMFPKEGGIEDVKKFLNGWDRKKLTNSQLTAVMKKLMGCGSEGMDSAAHFYEDAKKTTPSFGKLEIPSEYYIVCLNKTNRVPESLDFAKKYLDELAHRELTKDELAPTNMRTLYRDIGVNGEILGGMAKAFRVISKKADKGTITPEERGLVEKETGKKFGDPKDISRRAMEVSRDYYEAGFGVDLEFYPGINAVYNNLYLGDLDRAEKLAPLVQFSCRREGGHESTDYWNLVTQLELGLITKDDKEVQTMLPLVLAMASGDSYLDSTVDNMEKLSALRKQQGVDTKVLDYVAASLNERQATGFPPPAGFRNDDFIAAKMKGMAEITGIPSGSPQSVADGQEVDAERQAINKALQENSFSFKDINSRFVGGNWSFGGIIPDIPVNRASVKMARILLQYMGIDKETDFNVWNSRVEYYLNDHLGLSAKEETGHRNNAASGDRPLSAAIPDKRRVMEDLHSDVHKRMDAYRENLLEYTQSKDSGDSRTDLGVEMALGTVDCRQTAYSKQFLYDVWKRDNQTRLLHKAMDATMAGDESTCAQTMNALARIDREQMVTFTATLRAPIDMQEMYKMKVDDQGRPLPSPGGKLQDVENHTFNVLIHYDEKGLAESMEAKDAFYKSLYPLGCKPLKPEEINDKENGFFGGEMGVMNSEDKKIPFWILPTRYSGAKPKATLDECGELHLGGMVIDMPNNAVLMSDRAHFQHIVDAIAGMFIGRKKASVLNMIMGSIIDKVACRSHETWKKERDADLANPANPFLGWAEEDIRLNNAMKSLSDGDLEEILKEAVPNAMVSPDKLEAIRNGQEGTVIADSRYMPYDQLISSQKDGGTRAEGECALPPLVASLYLADFRRGEDLKILLDGLENGTDRKGLEELQKIQHVASMAAKVICGERSFERDVREMALTGSKTKIGARGDFKAYHDLTNDLAALDEYVLQPAAKWLISWIDSEMAHGGDPAGMLVRAASTLADKSADDAHNIGWKKTKDEALANFNDPFLGWAEKRIRVSPEAKALCEEPQAKEKLASFLSISPDRISDEKLEAIKSAKDGKDIVHHWYKPFTEVLIDQDDGGMRLQGQNSFPFVVLSLYLTHFRGDETATAEGLKKVLTGLLDGSDRKGRKQLSMLHHVAFQGSQLVYGERSFDHEVPELKSTGQNVTLVARDDIVGFTSLSFGYKEDLARTISPAIDWMARSIRTPDKEG